MELEDLTDRVESIDDLHYEIHKQAEAIILAGEHLGEKIPYSKALKLATQQEKVMAIMQLTTVLKSALHPKFGPDKGSPGALEAIAMALHNVSFAGHSGGNITNAIYDLAYNSE